MSQLIPFEQRLIGTETIETVNARDLHAFLEVSTKFSDWIRSRIDQYGFQENQDFVSFSENSEKGRPQIEYFITMDMAKQLAMVERNDKGKEARLYFIACEKQLREPLRKSSLLIEEQAERALASHLRVGKLLSTPEHIAQQEAVKMVKASTGIDYRPLLKAAPAQDAIAADEKMLEPTDLAKEFGWGDNPLIHGRDMNKAIATLGWQVKKIGGGWEATPAGKSYCNDHAWAEKSKEGYNLKWKVEAVRKALTEAGLLKQDQAVASESQ